MGLQKTDMCLNTIFEVYAQHNVSRLATKEQKQVWLKKAAKSKIDADKEGTIALLMEYLMDRPGEEFVEFT